MIRSNQAGQAKNRPPRREEGENGNLQRFPEETRQASGQGGSVSGPLRCQFPARVLHLGHHHAPTG
ncbi:hypothetical protein [Profundibacter sp.]|uniref:hypothetical protein n=1 Tax=Profundibacter sp. TaxID=3101071 RepID=UPI003D1382F9